MSALGTIAVGVDGSDCSRAALEFALEEAVRRRAAVRVVLAMPETDYVRALGGSPAHVLVDQSGRTDLLVVGHRGRGGSAAPCSARSACSACCTRPYR
jgi:nucleotide-binding universal stress UspA family protein